MADNLSREERVAAGLKKLRQFQQRAGKKGSDLASRKRIAALRMKPPTIAEEEPSEIEKLAPESDESEKSSVPISLSKSFKSASQENLARTSPESKTNDISSSEESQLSESTPKSKSDLDLSSKRESTEISSTESLLQISQQINGLMSETHAFLNGTVDQEEILSSDTSSNMEIHQTLERRNQQLASLIDQLRQSNDQLRFQIQESNAKNKRLQREFEQEKETVLEKAHKEQVALKDQLQVHIQTIGILVAEKTELQSSLALHQQTAKQKSAEVEELQGRLRASRQRSNDLERELNSLSNSKLQFEKDTKESSKEIDRLKTDNYKLSKSIEELKQQNAELSEKLSKRVNEYQSLESELADMQRKLSLAELYTNQVSKGNESSQLEELHILNVELEKQVSQHKESLEKLVAERDQISRQYQDYVNELTVKVTSLRDELKEVTELNETVTKERNVLAEKLENLNDTSISKDDLNTKIKFLEESKQKLEEELTHLVKDNGAMSLLIQEQNIKIENLERHLQRLQEQEIDKTKLLETMQSDKVAASRAIAQNIELKKQLSELQNGFVVMSNDKLQLTEKLQAEQHITKELGERLSQQEEELLELKEHLAMKENQLRSMEVSNNKGIYQQNQIADRMRHYEAQGHVAEMLQQELSQAKERIDSLENQNRELRMSLARQAESTITTEGSTEDKDAEKRNTLVASLSTSVSQLEMERNQMMKQLNEQKTLRTKLEEQLKSKEKQINHEENEDQKISREEYEMLHNAMQQLEERFKKTMNEIAELSEEKQRLEHLVLQLQGETDTIGDYIALYQTQRGLMKKRATEKDEYIAQLARDREDLKVKLGDLQDLIKRLVDERKQLNIQGIVPDFDISLPQEEIPDNLTISENENLPIKTQPQINGNNRTENTAKKIMDLLTEIETSNLVEKKVIDNFHPCPVCSGRLITV